jgi:hypothetical protein
MALHAHSVIRKTSGFAIGQVLIMLAILAVVITSLMSLFQKSNDQEISNLAKSSVDEMFGEVATILHRREACLAALGSPTSTNAAISKIFYSNPDGTQGQPFVSSGDTNAYFKITKIEIALASAATPIGAVNSAGEQAWLGTFRLQAMIPSLGNMLITRELPIYLILNGSTLCQCFVTKFTQIISPTDERTLEDQACATLPSSGGSLTHYDPANNACI